MVYITGKSALSLESRGESFTRLDAVGNVIQLGGKVRIFLTFGQHLQRAEDGESGANEGQELLVEDEERLQLDLAPLHPRKARPRFHREHVVTGMGKPRTQLIGCGGGLRLLHHASALIG